MTMIEVKCPMCGGVNVIRYGISTSENQRYYCKEMTCNGKGFQLEHSYTGCKVGINEKNVDVFRAIEQFQQEQREALGCSEKEFNPQGFVFTNELGRVMGSCQVQKHFNRFVKEAGLSEANVHATRHTFATRALSRSKDVNTVSAILGHAKPSTTLDMYGHTFDDRMRGLMEMMDD